MAERTQDRAARHRGRGGGQEDEEADRGKGKRGEERGEQCQTDRAEEGMQQEVSVRFCHREEARQRMDFDF